MNKEQIQESLGRIDNALAQLTVNRQVHIALINDVKLVQQYCMKQFENEEESKDGGTNIIPIGPEPCNEDIEGGGDSI